MAFTGKSTRKNFIKKKKHEINLRIILERLERSLDLKFEC